jgi:hypothetical protein
VPVSSSTVGPSSSRSDVPVASSTASRRRSLPGSSCSTGGHRGRARQLGGAAQPVVEGVELGALDVAQEDRAGAQQDGRDDQRHAEGQPAAEAAHGVSVLLRA